MLIYSPQFRLRFDYATSRRLVFRQARRKLDSARWDIQGGFHEDACFSAQQAAQLAAKALLQSQGRIGW